jgi:phospholipase C
MNLRSLHLAILLLIVSALCVLTAACGGGGSTTAFPPGYGLTTVPLSSGSVAAGTSATSTITVSPSALYSGTVALSCSVTGASSPLPTCSVSPASVSFPPNQSANATLTVTTSTSDPSGAYTVTVTGKDGNGITPTNGPQSLAVTVKFQHIVIIFQENRTPDNMFQDPKLISAGADIAQTGVNSQGQTITLEPTPLGIDYDLSHQHDAFTAMCDYQTSTGTCKMDGADQVTITCSSGATNCPPPNAQFLYVDNSSATNYELQPYWDMAEQYAFADHMFQTNEGPSFPAHQFILSGTSEPSTGSSLFVAENATGVKNAGTNTGCTAPATETVAVIDPSGSETSNPAIYPCFEHATLTDELDTAGVTWRYYAPSAGDLWTAPNAIQHICGPPQSTTCTGADWVNVSLPPSGATNPPILTDIANGQLQEVSWIIPTAQNSDHAGSTENIGGPSWVGSIVNAIGTNPSYWPNTAIIITWDDWGGWFDHVPPQVINNGSSWGSGYVYGFRVPMIVVSPLAQPGYISHDVHDFGSILNLIEETYGLPSLGVADAYADDLSDCFNFSQTPIPFTAINTQQKADFFIHDNRPPSAPDND